MLQSTQMTQQQNDTCNGQEIQPKLQLEGDQGNYIWKVISDLKMPPNPTREEYKAVYNASEEEVLKFQAFYLPQKNISHNLGTVNQVYNQLGVIMLLLLRVQQVLQLPQGFNLLLVVNGDMQKTPGSYKKTPVKGILEASGDLCCQTLSSYQYDKDKNLHIHFFVVLPSGYDADNVSMTIPSEKKVCIIHKCLS